MSDAFDALDGLGSASNNLLAGATRGGIAYVLWGTLHDLELDDARTAMASLAEDEALRHEAAMRRSEKLRAIASKATFFSGLACVDAEFRSILVAVTSQDFVLLDNWNHDPETEFARLARESITHAVIVDENGLEVADALIDPIRELETPQEERYAVVLKRQDPSGELPPVSFLFRSGEPALVCRDYYRRFIEPRT
jgi:hypothetical protein